MPKQPEVDFGYHWTTSGHMSQPNWRVSWDPEVGMLYAYQPAVEYNEPSKLVFLAEVRVRQEVDRLMGDWSNRDNPNYGKLFRLRMNLVGAAEWPAKIQIRVRRQNDKQKWEEIPVSYNLYCGDKDTTECLSIGNLAASWIIDRGDTAQDNRIVEVRYNLVDSTQGHYRAAPSRLGNVTRSRVTYEIRVRTFGDTREWDEIPVTRSIEYSEYEERPLERTLLEAQRILHLPSERAGILHNAPNPIEVRVNQLGNPQGHYVRKEQAR